MRETSFCRFRQVMGLALALTLTICGCRGEAPDSAPENVTTTNAGAGSDTIVVASTADIRGINELTTDATTLHSALFNWALFATLLDEQDDFDKGPPTFKPRLATSYEFSQDRLALTFKLREDAVWSDGEPVTAEDVRWTWQAQTHPDVAWGLADYKRYIRDVEVVDRHTVRFHFHEVYATQLLDANVGVILPKHAWSRLPFSQWRTHGD